MWTWEWGPCSRPSMPILFICNALSLAVAMRELLNRLPYCEKRLTVEPLGIIIASGSNKMHSSMQHADVAQW